MPIYEYVCDNCDEAIEIIQKVTDDPASLCPKCDHQSLRKKASISSFHLKGGGWYKDGYNGATSASSISDDKPSCTTTDSSESKPDTAKKTESSSETPAKPTNSAAESATSNAAS